jgi:serine/threonine protein phosphatase PrpC
MDAMVAAVTPTSLSGMRANRPIGDSSAFKLNAANGGKVAPPLDRKPKSANATGLVSTGDPNVALLYSRGTNGGRYDGEQQDRLIFGTSRIANATEARQALQAGFGEADEATAHFDDEGSTASVAAVTRDGKMTVAQVGDSRTMLVLRNKTTGKVIIHDLTVDQRPDTPAERERIEAAGGSIDKYGFLVGRDGYTVANSIVFGDHAFPEVSAEPSIKSFDLRQVLANPNIETSVLVCSDGLTDYASLETLAAEFEKDGTPAEIAERLKEAAFSAATAAGIKKSDNISLALARLDPKALNATYIGVADGHGAEGAAVAEAVRNQVHAAFHTHESAVVPQCEAQKRPDRPRVSK